MTQASLRRRVAREMRKHGAKPNDAYCDTCHTWYDLKDNRAVLRHAH